MTAIENIINQIENETRRFGNTKTRVAAVLRLIKTKLVELFSGKLDKGRYTGTADDLNNAIGNKVDKEAGKGLSTNDFTNAYKQKLDTLEDYDIELDENTTELRFKKGSNVVRRISLMFLDDEGTKLVYNKTEKTLELRDKRNNLLTSIPVSHFVSNIPDGIVVQNGKIKLMAGNNVIFENAFSYNDLADKPDLNFAPASHRHNWDDIDGKPAFNYLPLTGGNINGELSFNDKIKVVARPDGSSIAFGNKPFKDLVYGEFKGIKIWGHDSDDKVILAGGGVATISSIQSWVGGNISSNWEATANWQNSVIFVMNSLNIELYKIQHMGNMSFRKVFAGGQVTFTCSGKQIIYTGDNAFNGGDGSTAVVSIWNNKCYIDIRNI